MRNGELLIVKHIVRNSSLWSNIVFEEEVISHSSLLAWSLFLMHLTESTQVCAIRVFVLSLSSCIFDDYLSKNVHRFVIFLHLFGYTKWENTGLWQLPKVSSSFRKKNNPLYAYKVSCPCHRGKSKCSTVIVVTWLISPLMCFWFIGNSSI